MLNDKDFNLTTLLNNKLFVIFFAPFLLGAITILSFAPYNLTFINFFTFSILLFLILEVKKRKGIQKRVIEIKLNEYVPIRDNICTTSADHDQVYEIKFHGKPVNKFPLKNSNIENTNEKNKMNEIFFSAKVPTSKIAKPKNKDKNRGINIRAKGIKPLNISSCVKDIEIK